VPSTLRLVGAPSATRRLSTTCSLLSLGAPAANGSAPSNSDGKRCLDMTTTATRQAQFVRHLARLARGGAGAPGRATPTTAPRPPPLTSTPGNNNAHAAPGGCGRRYSAVLWGFPHLSLAVGVAALQVAMAVRSLLSRLTREGSGGTDAGKVSSSAGDATYWRPERPLIARPAPASCQLAGQVPNRVKARGAAAQASTLRVDRSRASPHTSWADWYTHCQSSRLLPC